MSKRVLDEYEPLLVEEVKARARTKVSNTNLLIATFAVCIGGTFQYGFNISVVNGATMHVQSFINQTFVDRYQTDISEFLLTLLWSIIVTSLTIGGFIGSMISGTLAMKLGRKGALLVNNIFALMAALMMGLSSPSGLYELLIFGRLLSGINAGIGLCVQTLYLSEIPPTPLRGALGIGTSVSITFGILIGQLAGLKELLGREELWPVLLSTTCIPAFLQLLILPFSPESPRYLLIDKGNLEGCKKALKQLHGANYKKELDDIELERKSLGSVKTRTTWDVIRDGSIRWQLITIMLLHAAQQLNGINAIYFYANYLFKQAGIPVDKIPYVTLGCGACECITALTCGFLIDNVGRKVLILGGYGLMSICCVLFTIMLSFQTASPVMPYLSVVCVFIFILSFGLGPGGVTNILSIELFTQTTRPAAYVIAGSVNWFSFFFIGLVFPFIVIGLQQYCFLVFLAICFFMALYIFLFIPETKNKTFTEIQNKLNSSNNEIHTDRAGSISFSTYF
ncbi:solute carrier family 2, facilitated glucose transporter member 11b [Brachionichthys hirsutus]|uniref:solute carrier family 2, facilitated glucose transporter member 11b n=1 Tax=Brachionichthys hirsutus TaxID=412623 RepID=UPI0036046968